MLELIDLVEALFLCRHLKLGVSDCSRQLSFLALYLLFNSHFVFRGKYCKNAVIIYVCIYIYIYYFYM